MHKRKITKAILILFGFLVLLGGVSPAYMAQGIRVEDASTRSAPRSLGTSHATVKGTMQWEQTYDGSDGDVASVVTQTPDGRFALGGTTASFGTGRRDTSLAKTISFLSGPPVLSYIRASSVTNTSAVLEWTTNVTTMADWVEYGLTPAYGTTVNATHGTTHAVTLTGLVPDTTYHYCVYARGTGDMSVSSDCTFTTTPRGDMEWSRTYGGGGRDIANSVIQTADGGFALAGETNSYGVGHWDAWLAKTDAHGYMEWSRTYGGSDDDGTYAVIQTADSGFVLAGFTHSFGAGESDFWLVKTDVHGNMEWQQTYGDVDIENARAAIQTADGGFALTGYTKSSGAGKSDFWLVKTDTRGTVEWARTYGGADYESAYSVIQTADSGFALTGYTKSSGAGKSDFWLVKTDARGTVEWARTYGGSELEQAYSVIQTADGGFALTGYTNYIDFSGAHYDVWLVKTNTTGGLEWNQTYSGPWNDVARAVIQMADEGYALAGSTESSGAGKSDFWLVKTDARGTAEWTRTYGGAGYDEAYAVIETTDGGFALAGSTSSYGTGGWDDYWLVKTAIFPPGLPALSYIHASSATNTSAVLEWTTDVTTTADWVEYGLTPAYGTTVNATHGTTHAVTLTGLVPETTYHYCVYARGTGDMSVSSDRTFTTTPQGDIEWSWIYSGSKRDQAYSVIQTTDGGFALAGYTWPYGAGKSDFWLVKTDANGKKQWAQAYGGSDEEEAYAVIQTTDGGFALAGCTKSSGAGKSDFWLVKTDAQGNKEWAQTYGGSKSDFARAIIQTADGGFALAGQTYSYGTGSRDAWLVKTDTRGTVEWAQTFGGSYGDDAYSVIQTADGGFALAGIKGFSSDEGFLHESFWLVKTDSKGVLQWNQTYVWGEAQAGIVTVDGGFALTGGAKLVKTDAQGNKEWAQTYGGSESDFARAIIQTADGGYALAGQTYSYGTGGRDAWLVRTDTNGTMEWYRTFGGSHREEAYAVLQTADGGFVLAGYTASYGGGGEDFLLVKLPDTPPPDTTPPTVTLTSPQHTTYATRRIPVYATNTTEPVHRAWWRYWNGSWSANQTLIWDEAKDQWEAAGLTWRDGSYQVQVCFNDSVGNTAVASEWFTVDATPPTVSSPADITYEEGMTGYVIAWTVGDRHPGVYKIYRNSYRVISGSWTNGTIPWNVICRIPDTYNYNVTLVVWDAVGNRVSDTVWVTVTAPVPDVTPPETPPVPELPVISTPVLLCFVALVILCVRKKYDSISIRMYERN